MATGYRRYILGRLRTENRDRVPAGLAQRIRDAAEHMSNAEAEELISILSGKPAPVLL